MNAHKLCVHPKVIALATMRTHRNMRISHSIDRILFREGLCAKMVSELNCCMPLCSDKPFVRLEDLCQVGMSANNILKLVEDNAALVKSRI